MGNYIDKTEELIQQIKVLDSQIKIGDLKKLILELADHLNEGIITKRPEVINKINLIIKESEDEVRGASEITPKLISALIKRIARKNFPKISVTWIIRCLPEEYKMSRDFKVKEKMIDSSEISDANLLKMSGELKKRIRGMENLGPAKEIKVKNDLDNIERHNWRCDMSNEMAKLAVSLDNEHEKEHNPEYCKRSAKIIRMARDKRYATTYSRYQAIVVQAEHTRSLANLAAGEAELLTRWETYDNEKNCKECIDLIHCRAEKCTHGCHEFKKFMTTKGIKWAFRETEELNQLQRHMKLLHEDSDDMCEFMKMIFTNPALKMNQGEKKNIMAKHIKKDDCDQCLYFTGEHPQFFKEHLK